MQEATPTESVSVVIPAYNARVTIKACIQSALEGSVRPLEVIVVDDCSTDDTAAIVEKLAADHRSVRLVRAPVNAGPARARNMGAAVAKGDYLFFIDSDTAMLHDTVERFLKRIPEADAVSGIYHPEPLNEGAASRYKAYLLAYFFGRRGVFEHDVFIASSAGIPARVFHDVGGFNENLPWGMDVENEEFGNRIVNSKYRILMDPSVNVRHHFPGIGKLTRTYFHRVSLWMELFLKRRRFEKGGNATLGTGLSTVSASAALAALPLIWVNPILGILAGIFFLWYLVGYWGFFSYVARRRPSFLPAAFVLNYWFSLVLAAGAAYGGLRWITASGRLSDRLRSTRL